MNGILRHFCTVLVCCATAVLANGVGIPVGPLVGRVQAQERLPMRFTLIDGSRLEGALKSSDRDGRLSIQSPWASPPMELSEAALLEGWASEGSGTAIRTKELDSRGDEISTLAFRMRDGSQYVGQVDSGSDQAIILRGGEVSSVRLPTEQIAEIRRPSGLLRPIVSAANAPHRFARQRGWRLEQGVLQSESPGAVLVADLDLPNRFRVMLDAQCSGDVDFEMILGKRSDVGEGQGGRPASSDRRGGSIARLPTETLVTRLEWFGSDVALVRSNASVSDSSLFPVNSGHLQLELLIDQERGWLMAYQSGQLVGQADLRDEEPIVRRRMTIFSRSDPVTLNRFEFLQWDGVKPESRLVPSQYTLLNSGTLLEGVPTSWTDQGFEVGRELIRWSDVSIMRRSTSPRYVSGAEVMLADGTRLRGHLLAQKAKSRMTLRDNAGQDIEFSSSRVTRFFGDGDRPGPRESGTQRLNYRGAELKGELLASQSNVFRWQADLGGNIQDLIPIPGLEISFDGGPEFSKQSASEIPERLFLRSGDAIEGRMLTINDRQLLFESSACGRVTVPSEQVQQLTLRPGNVPDQKQLDLLLSLPRRSKEIPPTHLLVSRQGDVLRGRLLGVDGRQVQIEIRGRKRLIPRERIGALIWLDPHDQREGSTGTTESGLASAGSAQAETGGETADQNTVTLLARSGTRLQLSECRFDGEAFQGTHPLLGACRLPAAEMQRLIFGLATLPERKPMRLVPVAEPKSFD